MSFVCTPAWCLVGHAAASNAVHFDSFIGQQVEAADQVARQADRFGRDPKRSAADLAVAQDLGGNPFDRA
jgi:hypothetical protein